MCCLVQVDDQLLLTLCFSVLNTINVDCYSKHLLTNQKAANMSEDAAPSVDEQRRIISCLELEPAGTYAYFVAAEWYEKWQRHVGYAMQQTPVDADRPGRLTMCVDHNADVIAHNSYIPPSPISMAPDQRNMLVDEKIWLKWVQWYGVADCHELDRRGRIGYSQAVFSICLLSSYSDLLKKRQKVFEITEECGYIELQLRRIFGVTADRKTKLWVREETTHPLFQPVLDRSTPVNSLLPGLNRGQQHQQVNALGQLYVQVSSQYRHILIYIYVYV